MNSEIVLKPRISSAAAPTIGLVLVVAGCGGSSKPVSPQQIATSPETQTTTPTAASPEASQRGYLAEASNGVLFIQWTRTGNTVTGTLAESYTDVSNPAQVAHSEYTFTGIINGTSITLALDNGDNWTGTLTHSSVTLNTPPDSDGRINSFEFNPATVAEYNTAVDSINSQGRAAAQAQEQRQANQRARDQITADAESLHSDISGLGAAVSELATDVTQLTTDLRQMRTDLAAQKQDLDQLLANRSGCSSGGDYQVSSTDNYQVTSTDDYQITSIDEYSISDDEQKVSDSLSQLRSDAQAAATDQASAPGYIPAAMPSRSTIQSAINAATAALSSAKAKWSVALHTVKNLDAQSNSYAARADEACQNA